MWLHIWSVLLAPELMLFFSIFRFKSWARVCFSPNKIQKHFQICFQLIMNKINKISVSVSNYSSGWRVLTYSYWEYLFAKINMQYCVAYSGDIIKWNNKWSKIPSNFQTKPIINRKMNEMHSKYVKRSFYWTIFNFVQCILCIFHFNDQHLMQFARWKQNLLVVSPKKWENVWCNCKVVYRFQKPHSTTNSLNITLFIHENFVCIVILNPKVKSSQINLKLAH